jgi:type VI secretion system secreted protein VgrG
VPYKLPDQKTKSTIKSNSSKGGDGYNEIRFEDRKKSEQIFVHAERNMDVHVKNDSFENILHDRHQTIGAEGKDGKVGDQNEMVFRDKNLKVHRNSQDHIGGDWKLLVGGIDGPGNVDVVIKSTRKELIHKDLIVKIKDFHALQAGKEIFLKSTKIVVEASSGITLKGPGGFITIDNSGIAIKGKLVLINSGGTALSGTESKLSDDAVEAQPVKPTLADDGKKVR